MVFKVIVKEDVKEILSIVNKALIQFQRQKFKETEDKIIEASNAFSKIGVGVTHQVGPNAVNLVSNHMRSAITYLAAGKNAYGLREIRETIKALNSILVDLKD